MQDPEVYLSGTGVVLPSVMDGGAPAVLDAAHRAYVNHETYFFADLDEKRRFDADPVPHCGMVTDPVTRERFRPRKESPRFDHAGRPYFFVSRDTLQLFRRAPETHALPSLEMLPEPAGS